MPQKKRHPPRPPMITEIDEDQEKETTNIPK